MKQKTRIIFPHKKIKEIEENIQKLEKSFSKLKKCYNYDDTEYKGIRDVGNRFGLSVDEDYYKPIRTNSDLMVILNMKVKV